MAETLNEAVDWRESGDAWASRPGLGFIHQNFHLRLKCAVEIRRSRPLFAFLFWIYCSSEAWERYVDDRLVSRSSDDRFARRRDLGVFRKRVLVRTVRKLCRT